MKVLKPNVVPIIEPDPMKKIELCGRVCYNSLDKICEGSAEKFYRNIVSRGHTSVLEHAHAFVYCEDEDTADFMCDILAEWEYSHDIPAFIHRDRYSIDQWSLNGEQLLMSRAFSGNIRAWRNLAERYKHEAIMIKLFAHDPLFSDIYREEQFRDADVNAPVRRLNSIPSDMHTYHTLNFLCSRAIANEIVRHRVFSFSQSSTRYINCKDLEVIQPWWFFEKQTDHRRVIFVDNANRAEGDYNLYLGDGGTPQLARDCLPQSTACHLVVTGNVNQWRSFFKLRCDAAAHPDIQIVAGMAKKIILGGRGDESN